MADMTPAQRLAVDRAFEIVRPLIDHACEHFIGREVDAAVLDGARAALISIRRDFPVAEHRIRLVNSATNKYAIVPANLYTALLMAGVRVEPDEVNDAVGQYLDEGGVRYQWDAAAEKLCVWPVRPVEYISVSFTVGGTRDTEPHA